jgi:hypothetical protein
MKLLKQDSEDIMAEGIMRLSQQLHNSSFDPFEIPDFEPPHFALRVNYLFFASISCSLVAAFGAVIGLQWVGGYDTGLSTSSSEERAVQRQFRFTGVEKWRMTEIIASLPILIFCALFFFFSGLADWLWHIHRGVAAVVMTGLGLSTLFFFTTISISMFVSAAPFRTPMTRFLPRLAFRPISWASTLVFHPLLRAISYIITDIVPVFYQFFALLLIRIPILLCNVFAFQDYSRLLGDAINTTLPFLRAFSTAYDSLSRQMFRFYWLLRYAPVSIQQATVEARVNVKNGIKEIRYSLSKTWESLKGFTRDTQNFRDSLYTLGHATASEREVKKINASPTLKLDCLRWLASTIELSPYLGWQFVILMTEIMRLPPEQILGFPWEKRFKDFIIQTLCSPYTNFQPESPPSEEDLNEMSFVSQCVVTISLAEDSRRDDYWSVLQDLAKRFPSSGISIYLLVAELFFQFNLQEALITLVAEKEKIRDEFFMLSMYKLRTKLRSAESSYGTSLVDVPATISHICQNARDDPLSPFTLNALMLLACEYLHSQEIIGDFNIQDYLWTISQLIHIDYEALVIHASITDQIFARLRVCKTVKSAEAVISDIQYVVSWREGFRRIKSPLHVVVRDIFDLMDRLNLHLTNLSTSHDQKLLKQAQDTIFLAIGLPDSIRGLRRPPMLGAEELGALNIYDTDGPENFIRFMFRIDWFMNGTSKRIWSHNIPRTNNVQFVAAYCMPLYFERKWPLAEVDLAQLKSLTNPNVRLQLSLMGLLNIDPPIPPRNNSIWHDQAWHESIYHWCISVGRGMRKGDRRIFSSSTVRVTHYCQLGFSDCSRRSIPSYLRLLWIASSGPHTTDQLIWNTYCPSCFKLIRPDSGKISTRAADTFYSKKSTTKISNLRLIRSRSCH